MKKHLKYSFFLCFIILLTSCSEIEEVKQPETTSFLIDKIFVFLYFFGGMMLGGLVVYFYSKWSIYSILYREKDKYFDDLRSSGKKSFFRFIGIVAILKESKDQKQEEIERLEKNISELKNKIKKLERDNIVCAYPTNPLDTEDPASPEIELSVEPTVEKPKELFFIIPEGDGSFKSVNAKSHKERDSFYAIVLEENGQKGKLHYLSGDYDSKALDNIDYYLNPVCEIENITERIHAKKVVMTESGIVFLSGDSWKIDVNNKVKIKLV